jgi:hypothetical protein
MRSFDFFVITNEALPVFSRLASANELLVVTFRRAITDNLALNKRLNAFGFVRVYMLLCCCCAFEYPHGHT